MESDQDSGRPRPRARPRSLGEASALSWLEPGPTWSDRTNRLSHLPVPEPLDKYHHKKTVGEEASAHPVFQVGRRRFGEAE